MKKILVLLVLFAVCAAAFLIANPGFLAGIGGNKPQAPGRAAPLPVVGVMTIHPEEVTITQELNGRVTPYLIAEVRPQVNGIILDRLFDEGSDVEKDAPLYQIDPAIYNAQLASAGAELARAYANREVTEAKLKRYEQLVGANAVNRQEYDEVESAARMASAEVGIAESKVSLASINVEYASVRSPISGRIGKSSVTKGALVTASQAEPLAIVQQLDPVYVDVAQPISWMLGLKDDMQAGILENTGQSYAEMRVVLDNGQPYGEKGRLLFADVTVDQTTGSISLRAEFPNPQHALLPGMYVTALLDVAQKDDAILVPQSALTREANGQAFVMVVHADNTVEKRPVATIRTIGNRWLLGDGLRDGERIIVEGGHRVVFAPGLPNPGVNPVEQAAESSAP
ncbi:MAG: efflux RND transporter periplasmic adaptor subunit [Planctomycetota bacterium]|jgi:membrane fusion protein (multidrug efflux system)|nr:efflux RND transporter periplasmic adaptor subunit [Planctomycetota bacterium]